MPPPLVVAVTAATAAAILTGESKESPIPRLQTASGWLQLMASWTSATTDDRAWIVDGDRARRRLESPCVRSGSKTCSTRWTGLLPAERRHMIRRVQCTTKLNIAEAACSADAADSPVVRVARALAGTVTQLRPQGGAVTVVGSHSVRYDPLSDHCVVIVGLDSASPE